MLNKYSSLLFLVLITGTLCAFRSYKNYKFPIEGFEFNDVHEGKKFHYFQTDQRVFMMRSNGDQLNIINFMEISVPDIIFAQQNCTHIAFDSQEMYSISACKDLSDNTTYMVMVSYLSSRPFYAFSMKTEISNTVQMRLLNDLLLVIDETQSDSNETNKRLLTYELDLEALVLDQQPLKLIAHQDNFNVDLKVIQL